MEFFEDVRTSGYSRLSGLQIYISMEIKILSVNVQEAVLPLSVASRYLSTEMIPNTVFLLTKHCVPSVICYSLYDV